MFKKIKFKAIRLCYRIINPFRTFYWYVFRPKTKGVKCVLEHDGKILLVRLNYAHNNWTFPGGRVNKNESFEDGARREIREELGVKLANLFKIGEYEGRKQYKRDTVYCFLCPVFQLDCQIDELEIREFAWFAPDLLPENRMPNVDLVMTMRRNYV